MKKIYRFTEVLNTFKSMFFVAVVLIFTTITLSAQTYELQLNPITYNGGYNISCNGASDGGINLVVIGGTAPYSYLWSTGATTQNLSNVLAGTYTVTVTDASSNSISSQKNLTQPQILQTTLAPQHVRIYGESNGSITQDVSGGTPPYSYLWSSGGTTSSLLNIPVGNYSITVTDANACTTQESTTITQPDQLIITVFNGTNVTCPAGEVDWQGRDGSIDAEVSGGIPPYIYDWSNGAFTQDIADLTAGDYTLRVTDQGGAQTENSITITQPNPFEKELTLSLYSNGYNVSCSECFNGSISAVVTGGTQPYTYSWTDRDIEIANTAAVTNLGGGGYILNITDQLGCIAYKETDLAEAPAKGWSRDGNTGITSTEFIGTVDNSDLSFKTNNVENLRIQSGGNIRINSFSGTQSSLVYTDSLGNLLKIPYSPPLVICAGNVVTPWQQSPYHWEDAFSCYRRFGIGTDSPREKLEVKGTMIVSAWDITMNNMTDYIQFKHDGGNARIENFGTGDLLINPGNSKNVKVATEPGGGFVQTGFDTYLATEGGNVGIGNTQPNYKLDVSGDINVTGGIRLNGNWIQGGLWSTNSTGIHYSSGNVGIGTGNTTLTKKLEVLGDVFLMGSTSTNPHNALEFTSNDGIPAKRGISLSNDHYGSFNFWINSDQTDNKFNFIQREGGSPNYNYLFTVTGEGKVGIGTTTPVEAFQIGDRFTFHSGGTKVVASNFRWDDNDSKNKRIVDGFASAISFTDQGELHFSTASNGISESEITWNTNFKIRNDGHISMGGNPHNDFKLNVCGGIITNKVRVPANWCDYVFEPDYELMSINNLRQFIETNKHLPEVPTQTEIESNGVDVGSMLTLHMKKIEELTLYCLSPLIIGQFRGLLI